MMKTWVEVLIPLLISCVNVGSQHPFCNFLVITPDPTHVVCGLLLALSESSPHVGSSYCTYDRLSADYGGPPGPAGISLWIG